MTVSIHAPHTGSDVGHGGRVNYWKCFNPTLPTRGATYDLQGGRGRI